MRTLFVRTLLVALITAKTRPMTSCGGKLMAKEGVIHTPNFPRKFPFPIYCAWVISAREDEQIRLYFTQIYVRRGLAITEYDFYRDDKFTVRPHELGTVNYSDPRVGLISNRSYVVVRFRVSYDITNMHLRVQDDLIKVFGFNMTYVVRNKTEPFPATTCSVSRCSYLGNCSAERDYSSFRCHCFKKFFGDRCQYGPECDPARGVNRCKNGGNCTYFTGAIVNRCVCSPGFQGQHCEKRISRKQPGCAGYSCDARPCVKTVTGNYTCRCPEGFTQKTGDGWCTPIDMLSVRVDVLVKRTRQMAVLVGDTNKLINQMAQDLKGTGANKLKITVKRPWTSGIPLELRFYLPKHRLDVFKSFIASRVSKGSIGRIKLIRPFYRLVAYPKLRLLSIRVHDKPPLVQNQLVTLVCNAEGSPDLRFRWFKKNHLSYWREQEAMLIDPSMGTNHWLNEVPDARHHRYSSMLNIRAIQPLHEGKYFCVVSDSGDQSSFRTTDVKIIHQPKLPSNYIARTIPRGTSSIIMCTALDDVMATFAYRWYRDGVHLVSGVNEEVAEDIIPVGSWLTIGAAHVDANYTCVVRNGMLSSNLTALVYVTPAIDNKTAVCQPVKELFRNDSLEYWVKWNYTAIGGIDIQLMYCPDSIGYVKRRCIPSARGLPKWSVVITTECVSVPFEDVRIQFEKTLAGYVNVPLWEILANLNESNTLVARNLRYAGDLTLSLDLLNGIVDYYTRDTRYKITLLSILEVLSAILSPPQPNHEEEREVRVLTRVLGLLNKMVTLDLRILFPGSPDRLSTQRIEFLRIDVLTQDLSISRNLSLEKTSDVNRNSSAPQDHQLNIFLLKNATTNNDIHIHRLEKGEILPPMVLVHAHSGQTIKFRIRLHFLTNTTHYGDNQSLACVKSAHTIVGGQWEWVSAGQSVTTTSTTVCTATSPGIYAIAALTLLVKEVKATSNVQPDGRPALMFAAVVILIVFSSLTSLIQIRAYGELRNDAMYMSRTNLSISILITTVIFLVCLLQAQESDTCVLTRVLWYYSYLSSFAFLVTESVCRAGEITNRANAILSGFKTLMIGWGLPCVGILCLVIASLYNSSYDRKSCSDLCGLIGDIENASSQLTAMLVPALSLITINITICLISVKAMSKWAEEHRKKERRKNLVAMSRSCLLLVLIGLSGLLGVSAKVQPYPSAARAFLINNIILGLALLTIRCFLDMKFGSWFTLKRDKKKELQPDRDIACKSFLETDSNGATGGEIESPCNNYALYKRHLCSLLGSGEYYRCESTRPNHRDSGVFISSGSDKHSSNSNTSTKSNRNAVKLPSDLFNITQNPHEFQSDNVEYINSEPADYFVKEAPPRGCDSTLNPCAVCTDPINDQTALQPGVVPPQRAQTAFVHQHKYLPCSAEVLMDRQRKLYTASRHEKVRNSAPHVANGCSNNTVNIESEL